MATRPRVDRVTFWPSGRETAYSVTERDETVTQPGFESRVDSLSAQLLDLLEPSCGE
jgi:hypothetical protein